MRLKELLALKGDALFHIGPDETLPKAIALLVEKDIGSLVVMDNGKMVGLVTFRELLSAIHVHGGTQGVCVSTIMVREPAVAGPDDTIDHMRTLMTEQHVRYLPIVDDGNLLGVLSFHDLARAALNAAALENRMLKHYIKNWPEESNA